LASFREHLASFREHSASFREHLASFREHLASFREHSGILSLIWFKSGGNQVSIRKMPSGFFDALHKVAKREGGAEYLYDNKQYYIRKIRANYD
jgi:hypothetical protein